MTWCSVMRCSVLFCDDICCDVVMSLCFVMTYDIMSYRRVDVFWNVMLCGSGVLCDRVLCDVVMLLCDTVLCIVPLCCYDMSIGSDLSICYVVLCRRVALL